jgi:hypothetical protein
MLNACAVLVDPTAAFPKLTLDGLTFTFACATVPKANRIATAAATFRILFFNFFAVINIFFPRIAFLISTPPEQVTH